MDLRRLRYFVVVAEESSFSRAAERLLVAQPSLSAQVKHLERELGVLLFDRRGRGIKLTDAGLVLLEEARRIFAQIEQTERMVERVSSGTVGRLSLGFVPSSSNAVLPPILSAFRRDYPDIELFLHEMKPDAVLRRLNSRQLDVGFLFLPFEDDALEQRLVVRELLVVALPEGHPLAKEERVHLPALRDDPFILPMRYQMPGLHGRVMEVCRRAGFTPKAIQKDVWLMQTVVALVAGGMGVALVPDSLRNFSRSGLVYREICNEPGGQPPTVETGVVWRKDDEQAVLQTFLETLETVAGKSLR